MVYRNVFGLCSAFAAAAAVFCVFVLTNTGAAAFFGCLSGVSFAVWTVTGLRVIEEENNSLRNDMYEQSSHHTNATDRRCDEINTSIRDLYVKIVDLQHLQHRQNKQDNITGGCSVKNCRKNNL